MGAEKILPLLAVVLLSALGVLADYLIKTASGREEPLRDWHLWGGAGIYFLSAFGWLYALAHIKMGSIGAIYSFFTAGLLILVGITFFKETLHPTEIVGIALGLISVVLLSRFI